MVVTCVVECVSADTYRCHLIDEFRQGGIRAQVGGVLLQEFQLFMEAVLVFLAAVPAATQRAEQHLPSLAPPLKNHHLSRVPKPKLLQCIIN